MSKNSYANIQEFAPNINSSTDDPLTYCLGTSMDQRFLHGSHADIYGQYSSQCQSYLGKRCADKWDDFCEVASADTSVNYPNSIALCNSSNGVPCRGMNAGDILVYNTAREKYLVAMHGCKRKYEPFDPTIPTSPLISYWVSDKCDGYTNCIPEYEVKAEGLDEDPVMNKILAKPIIALDLLINMFNTMQRKGTLSSISSTKLGRFYASHPLFTKLKNK